MKDRDKDYLQTIRFRVNKYALPVLRLQHYKNAVIFAHSYSGREKDLKIENIFTKIFKIVALDNTNILNAE